MLLGAAFPTTFAGPPQLPPRRRSTETGSLGRSDGSPSRSRALFAGWNFSPPPRGPGAGPLRGPRSRNGSAAGAGRPSLKEADVSGRDVAIQRGRGAAAAAADGRGSRRPRATTGTGRGDRGPDGRALAAKSGARPRPRSDGDSLSLSYPRTTRANTSPEPSRPDLDALFALANRTATQKRHRRKRYRPASFPVASLAGRRLSDARRRGVIFAVSIATSLPSLPLPPHRRWLAKKFAGAGRNRGIRRPTKASCRRTRTGSTP